MRLIDIASEYRLAADHLVDMEIPENAIADTLEGMAGEFEDKAKAVAAVILDLESEAKTQMEYAKRLNERAKSRQSRADWLRKYLGDQMQRVGIAEIADPVIPVKRVKTPAAVIISDTESVPDDFCTFKSTKTPDKRAIKSMIEGGGRVNWATLSQGSRLKIGG